MDIKTYMIKICGFLKKYRYAFLVLAMGMVFILLPGGKEDDTSESMPVQQLENRDIDRQLAEILAKLDGAGKVDVMLTESTGEEKIFQIDDDYSESDDQKDSKNKTVIVTNSEKSETALVKQINPPAYLGAVVVCQGADNAAVRLAIVDAVSKITGLGADCISVLKMRS